MDADTTSRESLPPPDPSYAGSYYCEAYDSAGDFLHDFVIMIGTDRTVTGVSCWLDGGFMLDGSVDRYGYLHFADHGASYGFLDVSYVGYVDKTNGTAWGWYGDDTYEGQWYGVLDANAEPSCEVGVVAETQSAINGGWIVTSTDTGELLTFCLTIESERPTECFDICDGPNILLTSKPILYDSDGLTIEFTVQVTGDFPITNFIIEAVPRTPGFYDVVIIMEMFGEVVDTVTGQMERVF